MQYDFIRILVVYELRTIYKTFRYIIVIYMILGNINTTLTIISSPNNTARPSCNQKWDHQDELIALPSHWYAILGAIKRAISILRINGSNSLS